MKTNHLLKISLLLITVTSLSSCSVIGGIFKTGMGVGAIVVLAIVGLAVYFIFKSGKK